MEYLYELGFNDYDIKEMIEANNDIVNLSKEEITSLVNILMMVGCRVNQVKNIITANPFYLSRSIPDIQKLITKLYSLNITNLETTFDSNPWLLNIDAFEIDKYIEKRQNDGVSLEDIIDEIDMGYFIANW